AFLPYLDDGEAVLALEDQVVALAQALLELSGDPAAFGGEPFEIGGERLTPLGVFSLAFGELLLGDRELLLERLQLRHLRVAPVQKPEQALLELRGKLLADIDLAPQRRELLLVADPLHPHAPVLRLFFLVGDLCFDVAALTLELHHLLALGLRDRSLGADLGLQLRSRSFERGELEPQSAKLGIDMLERVEPFDGARQTSSSKQEMGPPGFEPGTNRL